MSLKLHPSAEPRVHLDRHGILDIAKAAVTRRAEAYGEPGPHFDLTAKLWSALLNVDIAAEEVAVCLALLKVARLNASPDHADSAADLAGYAAIAHELAVKGKAGADAPPSAPDGAEGLDGGVKPEPAQPVAAPEKRPEWPPPPTSPRDTWRAWHAGHDISKRPGWIVVGLTSWCAPGDFVVPPRTLEVFEFVGFDRDVDAVRLVSAIGEHHTFFEHGARLLRLRDNDTAPSLDTAAAPAASGANVTEAPAAWPPISWPRGPLNFWRKYWTGRNGRGWASAIPHDLHVDDFVVPPWSCETYRFKGFDTCRPGAVYLMSRDGDQGLYLETGERVLHGGAGSRLKDTAPSELEAL